MNVKPLTQAIVFDIETVPAKLNKQQWKAWEANANIKHPELTALQAYKQKAALYPEFARVACISLGYFKTDTEFTVKCIISRNEKAVLQEFIDDHNRLRASRPYLTGHYVKGFDMPFILRRLIINRMNIPGYLDPYGKKPWDINWIEDTHEIWKCGSFASASLNAICAALEIPTPKDEITGADVASVWEDKKLSWQEKSNIIATYCNKDVIATARVLKRFHDNEDLPDEGITNKV